MHWLNLFAKFSVTERTAAGAGATPTAAAGAGAVDTPPVHKPNPNHCSGKRVQQLKKT